MPPDVLFDWSDNREQRIMELLDAAVERPPADRWDFLLRETGDDEELREAVHDRLMDLDLAGPFMGLGDEDAQKSDIGPGYVVNGFRLIDPLDGKDTSFPSCVYLAESQSTGRQVALKIIHPHAYTAAARHRFMQEIELLKRARVSAGTVRILHSDEFEFAGISRPFFVMELVKGKTLDEYVTHHRIKGRELLELLVRVSRAVTALNSLSIVHRDLKPHNIMITDNGTPKLIDLGIGRLISTTFEGKTASGDVLGTRQYMSPEQAAGKSDEVTWRSDVYSMGVITYEMLCGHLPIRLPEVMWSEKECENHFARIPRLRKLAKLAKGSFVASRVTDIDAVVHEALQAVPERRFHRLEVNAFAENLELATNLKPLKFNPPGRIIRFQRFCQRNPLSVLTVVAFIMLSSGWSIRETAMRHTAELVERRAQSQSQRADASLAIAQQEKKRADESLLVAEQRRSQVEHQLAVNAAKTAALAEARGRWNDVLICFQAAEAGGDDDLAIILTGQLRALDRLGKRKEGLALMRRVKSRYPAVFSDPKFAVMCGFFDWTANPRASQSQIEKLLASNPALSDGDLYFARALVSNDIVAVSNNLKKSVAAEPFNRDAWAILSLADLLLGHLADAEREAQITRLLYPEDDASAVIAAVAASLEGNATAATQYILDDEHLSQHDKSAFIDFVDFTGKYRSVESIIYQSDSAKSEMVQRLAVLLLKLSTVSLPEGDFPHPTAFSWIPSNAAAILSLIVNHDRSSATAGAVLSMPIGAAHYVKGVLEMNEDPTAARAEFRIAATMPSPIECRREALLGIVSTEFLESFNRHLGPKEMASKTRGDLQAVCDNGGFPVTDQSLPFMLTGYCGNPWLADLGRQLVLQREALDPHDPQMLFIQARAEWALGRRELAMALLKVRLGDGENPESRALLQEITRTPATQPAEGTKTPID